MRVAERDLGGAPAGGGGVAERRVVVLNGEMCVRMMLRWRVGRTSVCGLDVASSAQVCAFVAKESIVVMFQQHCG